MDAGSELKGLMLEAKGVGNYDQRISMIGVVLWSGYSDDLSSNPDLRMYS